MATGSAGFYIRRANKDDMGHILDLIKELAIYEKELSSVEATEETLLTTLGFNDKMPGPSYAKTLLLFSEDDAVSPAGFALYFYNYSTWRSKPGIYLEDLFVREKYRGRGYGKALISALAKEVERVDGARLEWSVLKWNTPSIEFYESEAIGATAMSEWQTMRVDGERLKKLAIQGPTVQESGLPN
ncbi:acyl-CoA N-acyltransferase [Kalaharituber pfeilii]|nr:acyl-CoA N-acyltransferase [Kalaharituber pfeilii]